MGDKCTVKLGKETHEGIFMGVYQFSDVLGPSPMIGGHSGGTVAYPVAVVMVGDALYTVRVKDVKFNNNYEEYFDILEGSSFR